MKELVVTSSESNQRLNKYLMKYLNQAPSSFVYKMLRKKNITLNGKKASGDEIINPGDIIKLFLADETIDKFREIKTNQTDLSKTAVPKLTVIYQDKDIMAVHKPAGILSQKATDKDISINELILDYCMVNNLIDASGNTNFKPSVCNRLDRNTSGIILAGISLSGSQNISKILKEHNCDKYYYTIIKGNFTDKIHSMAYIIKDTAANVSEIITIDAYNKLDSAKKKDYNYVETIFEPVSKGERYTLLKIKLITGKSHQIRATLKHLGYPIVGDSKYGDVSVNRYMRDNYKLKHHLLHAASVSFKDLTINDPLPEIFINICKRERINIDSII